MILGSLSVTALFADQAVPFVVGFERFARHQDITDNEAGALLIAELSCTACHPSKDRLLEPKRGPRLDGVGNRLRNQWVQQFVEHPRAMRGGTTMPDVMHAVPESDKRSASEAIASFLATQTSPFKTLKAGGALPVVHEFWKKGNRDRGRTLYHQIGCVACHQPDSDYQPGTTVPSPLDALLEQLDPEEIEEMGLARNARRVASIPHGKLAEKYSARSLTMMLLDPASVRPDARMPSLKMQPIDAADIAAYLLGEAGIASEIQPITQLTERAELGRKTFEKMRCMNCHETKNSPEVQLAKPLEALNPQADSSCISNAGPNMPHYHLDEQQRRMIQARLAKGDLEARTTAHQTVQHRMLQLNCYACHERKRIRDGETLGGVGRYRKPFFETKGQIDIGDEGRLPPPLTLVGAKLLPAALKEVFDAKTTARRPFMTIRMPAYSHPFISELIEGFPAADHSNIPEETKVFGELDPRQVADLETAGRELVNTGCVECHAFAGESLPGAVGVDIDAIHSRVRPGWFYEFLRDPGKTKARTRMPSFFPNGQSNRKDLLGGDVQRQIAAIWYYLKKTEPLPQKIVDANSRNFELIPSDRPLVIRTFMRDVGTHAIAVGLPGGLNYAFDAERTRVAIGWKRRFLDARSTWFERFAPPAEPLGQNLIQFPKQDPFVFVKDPPDDANRSSKQADGTKHFKHLEHAEKIEFGGYRVDSSGTPTFLYRLGIWDIEDRLEGGNRESLRRTWTVRRSDRRVQEPGTTSIAFCPHAAKQLDQSGPMSMVNQDGLDISVQMDGNAAGMVIDHEGLKRWLIPLPDQQQQVIKAEYRW